jgi:hypothetical protein
MGLRAEAEETCVAPSLSLEEKPTMKTRAHLSVGRSLTWLAVLLAIVLSAGVSQAATRTLLPDPLHPLPYYARHLDLVGGTSMIAFVFYRSPECVPPSVNLWQVLHPEQDYADCPFLMQGFSVWKTPPFTGTPPIQQVLQNTGLGPVPIWFADATEVVAALQDHGAVTIEDLEGMASLLKGSATSYYEVLQPGGGAKVPSLNITASGHLEDEDGTPFFMLWEQVGTDVPETILRFSD